MMESKMSFFSIFLFLLLIKKLFLYFFGFFLLFVFEKEGKLFLFFVVVVVVLLLLLSLFCFGMMMKVVVALCLFLGLLQGCSYVQLKYGDSMAIGRSMELPTPVTLAKDWRAVTHPAHTYSPGPIYPNGKQVDLKESNPIGFISIDGVFRSKDEKDIDILHVLSGEGMNEYGLSVSAQTFVSSEYERVHLKDRNVEYFYFLGWALGNYKTADELIYDLRNNVSVIDPTPTFSSLKFHWGVSDATGANYVIEYIQGKLQVWDNSDVGVMTNDPTWGWHVENLNTFATVSPLWSSGGTNLAMKTPLGTVPKITSNGYNTYGLPGDYTPQSRFVRLWYLRESLLFNAKKQPETIDDATVILTALVNAVFIPKGALASELKSEGETKVEDYDFTQFDILKFPDQKMFYFRSYDNMIWKKVNLDQFNFTVGAKSVSTPIYDGQYGVQDVNSDFH